MLLLASPPALLRSGCRSGGGGEDERLRRPARPRPPDRAPAQGRQGLRPRRERPLRGPPRRPLHRQVRERGQVQRHRCRHHLARRDRRALWRLRAGPLPLVPRPRHPARQLHRRHNPLRRRRRRQEVPAVSLRGAPGLRPGVVHGRSATRGRRSRLPRASESIGDVPARSRPRWCSESCRLRAQASSFSPLMA